MPDISAASLLKLIQIVDRDIGSLREAYATDPKSVNLYELNDYDALADELESLYEEATAGLSNYPDYSELVSHRNRRD